MTKRCPSAECSSGNWLFGLVRGDGTVGRLTPPVKIDKEFVDIANLGRDPQKRFRFVGDCVEKRCEHWNEKKCQIAKQIVTAIESDVAQEPIREPQKCSFRPECRWFSQEGWAACGVCLHVITAGK